MRMSSSGWCSTSPPFSRDSCRSWSANCSILFPSKCCCPRAYRVRSPHGLAILHAEYETSANGKMDKRLLVSHALFLEEYELPVISVII
jgi:hypothetical protein